MTTRYAKELLQSEVMLALGTAPASANMSVAAADMLEELGPIDPGRFPLAIVYMPVESSSQSISENLQRVTYRIEVVFHPHQEEHARHSDTEMSKMLATARQSLAAYYGANLRRLGIFPNAFTWQDDGWAQELMGSSKAFLVTLEVEAHIPTTQAIET